MWNSIWVFLGGGAGALARFAVSGWVANSLPPSFSWSAFPWGTLLINVSGSFVIGFFNTATASDGRWMAPDGFRQFFMVGICGGYTTFSSFSLQTLALARDGEWFKAGANSVLSVVLCLFGVWLGHVLAATLNQLKGH